MLHFMKQNFLSSLRIFMSENIQFLASQFLYETKDADIFSFIMIYMIFFIKDLDNPFGYSDKDHLVEEVSLKPILDAQKRLGEYCN